MRFRAYTDGASSRDGRGGWAYVIVSDEDETSGCRFWQDAGGTHDTTNQRMELEAAVRALEFMPPTCPVEIVSDSAYLVNCFVDGWYVKWEANGWVKRGGAVANRDLWERLLALVRARTAETRWRHVRGHQGNRWNEIADDLAVAAKPEKNREAVAA